MRLVELEGTFIKYEAREPHDEARRLHPHLAVAHWLVPVEEFEEAHGIQFLCPKSVEELGKLHAHRMRLWFFGKPVDREVGKNTAGKIIRFRIVSGRTIDTITLAPSVAAENDHCGWSGSIINGEAATFERAEPKSKVVVKKGAKL